MQNTFGLALIELYCATKMNKYKERAYNLATFLKMSLNILVTVDLFGIIGPQYFIMDGQKMTIYRIIPLTKAL
jgi:hypothetical protein